MLQQKKSRVLLNALLVLSFLSFFVTNIHAEDPSNVVYSLSKNAIANLNNGIKSENLGLRKSSIQLVGKRVVSECAETLVEQFNKEENPELRILIVRSLYIIGNEDYLEKIYKLASTDADSNVRKMGSAIHSMMQVNNSMTVVDISK